MRNRDAAARAGLRQLSLHEPPAPGDRLRRRVLEAAGRAVQTSAPPTFSERLWLSRPWRLGWVAALALMLAAQIMIARSTEGAARRALDRAAGWTQPAGGPDASMAEMVARELELEPGGSIALAARTRRPPRRLLLPELPPKE